jgi:hypothetical protein
MKREDVLKVDDLRTALDQAMQLVNLSLQQLSTTMRSVFGEVVFALDTVIDKHNTLERELQTVERQLQTVADRVLALEQQRGAH